MNTYMFCENYNDIKKMVSNLPKYVIKYNLDLIFCPPFLAISVPVEKSNELLKWSQGFVADKNDTINIPKKIIRIPCECSKNELHKVLNEYDALAYAIEDTTLMLFTEL